MRRARTRTSPAAPLLAAAALVALCGCAPHRRGPLGPRDGPAPRRDVPGVEAAPRDDAPPAAWRDVDRSLPAADQVCALAESLVGTPYRYGGATPRGFDCSGLVLYVYREVGLRLPRVARDQARAGRRATLDGIAPGDLIFFRIGRDVISHVGIYTGGGKFVHAPGTGKSVRVDSLGNDWWARRVKAVRRVLPG